MNQFNQILIYNVIKIGSDRTVQPIEPRTGLYSSLVELGNRFFIEPTNRWKIGEIRKNRQFKLLDLVW
jgi:hypothetical protein